MGRHRRSPRSRAGARGAEAEPDRSHSAGTGRRDRWAAAVLAAVTLALYGPSVRFGFVHADDVDLIAGNAAFLGDPGNLPRVLARSYFETAAVTTDVETYYRPLVIASFMADTVAGGGAPGFFHATNAVLHAFVAVLALGLLRGLGAGSDAAFAGALIFAVHPLDAQAVYWIPGRNELLLALFVLMAWLAWLRALCAEGARRARWLAAHGAAWLFALLSKETASIFPLVWALHAWQARRWGELARLPLLTTWLVAGLVWLGLRTHALGWGASGGELGAFVAAVWSNLPGMVVTIGKVVLPWRLNVTPGADWPGVAVGVAAMALLGAVFARCLPLRTQAFVWGWCLLAFLPGLGVSGLPAYEHRAYLPLLALVCGMALALERLAPGLAAAPALRPPHGRRDGRGAAEARRDRSDPGALRGGGRATSADEPAGPAPEPAGGRGTESAAPLRLDAGSPLVRVETTRAGSAAVRTTQAGEGAGSPIRSGEPTAAVAVVRGRSGASGGQRPFRSLESWMRTRVAGIGVVAIVCAALGAATLARGPVYADPFRFWEDGARDPQFGAMARVNLGQIFESIDRLEEAERQYRLALELDPLVPKAHNNLGVVLMALGRRADAVVMFERERALHPGNPDAHYNLGLVRRAEGRLDEAIALWERAIAANRAYLPAYEELARAYRTKGMPDRAAAFDEQAAALRRRTRGR